MYGRGASSIAEQIGKSVKEAQEIMDKFFNAYPTVKNWIKQTQDDAKKYGYVEDWFGRRRRLPDIQLPKYELSLKDDSQATGAFNPFFGCKDRIDENSNKLLNKYKTLLENSRSLKDYEKIQADALKEGVIIHNNSGFIAQAERQSVNARIQGGSATLTKLAMINIDNDPRLKELGFELLITVHDEVIGQCPEENADAVAKILPQIMIDTARPFINVPLKCDPAVVKAWYEDEYQNALGEEYKKYVNNKGMNDAEAFDALCKNHIESLPEHIKELLEAELNHE